MISVGDSYSTIDPAAQWMRKSKYYHQDHSYFPIHEALSLNLALNMDRSHRLMNQAPDPVRVVFNCGSHAAAPFEGRFLRVLDALFSPLP